MCTTMQIFFKLLYLFVIRLIGVSLKNFPSSCFGMCSVYEQWACAIAFNVSLYVKS